MSGKPVIGRVSSIQTLGTLDGHGVRFVIFVQGCPLRCGCCHNPETWDTRGGTEYTAEEMMNRILRYKEYFGTDGGVTVSGGEALLQPDFALKIFQLCRQNGINTCLDTSGCILNDKAKELLEVTDCVLLDIKYTNDEGYQKYVGCSMKKPLEFLDYLDSKGINTWIRQVIISGLNDDDENLQNLAKIITEHSCIKKTELLAFRKLCVSKYNQLGFEFPFADIPETSETVIRTLERKLKNLL